MASDAFWEDAVLERIRGNASPHRSWDGLRDVGHVTKALQRLMQARRVKMVPRVGYEILKTEEAR